MLNTTNKIIKHKTGLLNLAEQLAKTTNSKDQATNITAQKAVVQSVRRQSIWN